MGWLESIFRESRFHPSQDPPEWWIRWTGAEVASGITVTPELSIQCIAVFACVRILSESVASLPLHLYRRRPDRGKERAADHWLYPILHDLPNPEMTSFELREILMGHLALWGNAFAEIEYDGAGRVRSLWPLRPDRMRVRRQNGELYYHYTLPNGGPEVVLPRSRIWHLRGFGYDGVVGYSPIALARQAVGLALATEEFGARFFGNGARPGIVLEHPGVLSDEAHRRLRESWEERHQGLSRAHRVAILEEGMKVHEVGIPPEDAQFLETRRFQVTEIARLYRIPPHMLADLERATFSNIEHQSLEFVIHTLRPWLVRWEQAIYRDLIPPQERGSLFAEFLVDGLLRGDIESRYRAYAVGRQNGWLSANDIRELENMNPIPEGGDIYLVPLNMVPAASLQAPTPPQGGQAEAGQRALPPAAMRAAEEDEEQERARRIAEARWRLAEAWRPLLADAAGRILRREMDAIRGAARRFLGRRALADFDGWLARFYEEEMPGIIERAISAPLRSYGELVAAEAADEIAYSYGEGDDEALDDLLGDYRRALGDRWIGSSRGQIRSVVGRAAEAGGDPLEALEGRLGEWEERRPGKFGRREAIQIGNAVAWWLYRRAGRLRLRWVARGSSCPYCSRLDGRIVGIQEAFLSPLIPFHPEGADRPLTPRIPIRHPPAHDGCDCMVVAG